MWTKDYFDFTRSVIGVRTILLYYVICDDTVSPATAPNLENNQPFATEFGYFEEELIARATHNHPLYRDNNSSLYFHLEEETRSTTYAASI